MWYPLQTHHYRFFRNLPSLFRDCISFASLLLVCGLRHSRQSINQSNAKLKPITTSLFPVYSRIRQLICLYLEFSLASSDISFFLPLFGLGFTRLNRKTRSLSCLMSAIGYCIVWFFFLFPFLWLLLFHDTQSKRLHYKSWWCWLLSDDITKSLHINTTIIDRTVFI